MQAKLIVVRGRATRSEVELKLPVVIGRHKDADLTIEHPTISRRHCELFEKDGALVVRDFGSLNGTLVDDQRVKIELLKPGGVLTVGPLSFRAEYELAGDLPELGSNPLDSGTVEFTPVAEQGAAATAQPAVTDPPAEEVTDDLGALRESDLSEGEEPRQARVGPVELTDESHGDLGFELEDDGDDRGAAGTDRVEPAEIEESDPAADELALLDEPDLDERSAAADEELGVEFSPEDEPAADETPIGQAVASAEREVEDIDLGLDLSFEVADDPSQLADEVADDPLELADEVADDPSQFADEDSDEVAPGAGDVKHETAASPVESAPAAAENPPAESSSQPEAADDELLDFEALVLEDVEAVKEASQGAHDVTPEAPAEETPSKAQTEPADFTEEDSADEAPLELAAEDVAAAPSDPAAQPGRLDDPLEDLPLDTVTPESASDAPIDAPIDVAGDDAGPADADELDLEDLGLDSTIDLQDVGRQQPLGEIDELPPDARATDTFEEVDTPGDLAEPLTEIDADDDADDFELRLDDQESEPPADTSAPPGSSSADELDFTDDEPRLPSDKIHELDWSGDDDPTPPAADPRADLNPRRDNGGVDEELDLSDVDFHLESTRDLLDDLAVDTDYQDGAVIDEPGAVELIVKKKSPLRAAKETVTIVSEAPIESVASTPASKKSKRKRSWWPFRRKKKAAPGVQDEGETKTPMDSEAPAEADQEDTPLEATDFPDTLPSIENTMNASPELPDKSTEKAVLQDVTDAPSSTETADVLSEELELTFDLQDEEPAPAAESAEDNAADSVMNLLSEDEPAAIEPQTAAEVDSPSGAPPRAEEANGEVEEEKPQSRGDSLDDNVAAFLAAAEEEDDAEPAHKPSSTPQGRPAKEAAELDDFLKDLGLS